MPDQRDRHLDSSDPQVRQQCVAGLSAAENVVGRPFHDVEGHPVHDREGGRIGCRRGRNHRAQTRRRLASVWREMVLLAHRCRRRADAGPARRRTRRHPGPCAVRDAAPDPRRRTQRLSDRSPEGQAGHAIHGQRRNSARGRRSLSGRPAGPGPEADDGAGESVPPVAWRARRRDDAPLRQRGLGSRPGPHRVRPDGRRFPADAAATDEAAGAGRAGAVHGVVHRRRDGSRGAQRNCAS